MILAIGATGFVASDPMQKTLDVRPALAKVRIPLTPVSAFVSRLTQTKP